METTGNAADKDAVARTKAALAAFHEATDFQPPEVSGRFVCELLDHNGHPGAWEFVTELLTRYMDLGQFRVAVERLEAARVPASFWQDGGA